MTPRPTLEKIESPEDYDFHDESVLLISEKKQCYGYNLEDFLCELLEDTDGYGDYYEHTSHSEGYELLKDASPENKIISLENSIWLVEGVCFGYDKLDLVSTIQSDVPPQAEVIIWSDPDSDESLDQDLSEIASQSHKIFHAESEQSLRTAIVCYFTRDCHPGRSKHCVEWKKEARRQQEMIL